jgi:hypothetical protein
MRSVVRFIGLGVALSTLFAIRALPIWPGPDVPFATRLTLLNDPPHLIPAIGCPAALILPVRFTTSGNDAVFLVDPTGEELPVRWPSGWSAWRTGDTAILISRGGSLIAREGEVISDMGGGYVHETKGSDVETFHACVAFG